MVYTYMSRDVYDECNFIILGNGILAASHIPYIDSYVQACSGCTCILEQAWICCHAALQVLQIVNTFMLLPSEQSLKAFLLLKQTWLRDALTKEP